jgi:hypothetical protein
MLKLVCGIIDILLAIILMALRGEDEKGGNKNE